MTRTSKVPLHSDAPEVKEDHVGYHGEKAETARNVPTKRFHGEALKAVCDFTARRLQLTYHV